MTDYVTRCLIHITFTVGSSAVLNDLNSLTPVGLFAFTKTESDVGLSAYQQYQKNILHSLPSIKS